MPQLTGCCLSHEWYAATCETPKTCAKCDKVEGEALGHDWEDATCETPKTCARCGLTKGDVLEHTLGDWEDADTGAVRKCSGCTYSETMSEKDWLARQFLVGEWHAFAIGVSSGSKLAYDVDPSEFSVTFYEDGTFEQTCNFYNNVNFTGTWKAVVEDEESISDVSELQFELYDEEGEPISLFLNGATVGDFFGYEGITADHIVHNIFLDRTEIVFIFHEKVS